MAIDTNCIGEAGDTDMPSTNALVTLGVEKEEVRRKG